MHLVEIDDVGAQSFQARFAFTDQMPTREAAIVRPLTHGKARLGRYEDAALALAAQSFADNLFRGAARIYVRRIDKIHARVDDQIDLAPRLIKTDIADLGEIGFAAYRHRAHRERRDFEARIPELPIFHIPSPLYRFVFATRVYPFIAAPTTFVGANECKLMFGLARTRPT